ncbi:MAG TPA: PD-(D/E)XK nuclease family protein [Nannocystis sp.]
MQNKSTNAAPDGLLYLAQSECGDWAGCPARAWARYVLGVRPPDAEDRPRRIGSMGHAVILEALRARHEGRDDDPHAAIAKEAARRGWPDLDDDEVATAIGAARTAIRALGLDRADVLPDIYSDTPPGARRGPLAEVRLWAKWDAMIPFFRDDGGAMSPLWRDIMRCEAVRARFAGIEGQPDLVYMPEGPGGPVVVVDYKFRKKPDLGGAASPSPAAMQVPDRQAAWYLALLHAVGLRPAGGIEFWQVNIYGGRWLTVDDFLEHAQTGGILVTDKGLPTRDTKRLTEAGGMVSAEVWAEAHRLLASARLERRLADWRTPKYTAKGNLKKQGDPPDRLSPAEVDDARRFIADLEAYNPVAIRTFRVDPLVCREVVRDMIVGVDAPLSQVLRGMTPARVPQNYASSPCVKPNGCAVRTPCMVSHGAGDFRRAIADFAAQGALVEVPRLGAVAAGLRVV